MRIEGTLARWNDERGFGFIAPGKGGSEVFVHVSAFPGDGQRPSVGEHLTFEIETDQDGKKRATRLFCPDRPIRLSTRQRASRRRHDKPGFFRRIVAIAVLVALAAYAYGQYSRRVVRQTPAAVDSGEQAVLPAFRCDGRTHCSQMTSCAEATFFLHNCPNVQMDGDNDGVPCERQLCGN